MNDSAINHYLASQGIELTRPLHDNYNNPGISLSTYTSSKHFWKIDDYSSWFTTVIKALTRTTHSKETLNGIINTRASFNSGLDIANALSRYSIPINISKTIHCKAILCK